MPGLWPHSADGTTSNSAAQGRAGRSTTGPEEGARTGGSRAGRVLVGEVDHDRATIHARGYTPLRWDATQSAPPGQSSGQRLWWHRRPGAQNYGVGAATVTHG